MLPELPCQIPSLRLGCFGCCGRLYLEKEKVQLTIHKNTLAWQQRDDKMTLRDFCWRQTALTQSGVCVNIIEENKMYFCAVHPKRNPGKQDPRINYCNTKFLCEAAKKYEDMDETTKQKYIDFLAKKKLNSYEYSMANDKEQLIREFERIIGNELS